MIHVPARSRLLLAATLSIVPLTGWVQPLAGIYTCTDASGRRHTADRYIEACKDRQQRRITQGGNIEIVEPSYTPRELAEREEKTRQAELARSRALEERRRERALLTRYPGPAAHDRERAEALAQIEVVITAARKRIEELRGERRKIENEMEFYAHDPAKAPGPLKRQLEDSNRSLDLQMRFIGDQEQEKRRVNARFDEERSRLAPLWASIGSAGAATDSAR